MRNPNKTILGIAVILVLVGTYIGIRSYVDRSVKRQVDREIERVSSFAHIRYEAVDVDFWEKKIRFTGVFLSPRLLNDHIRMDELIVYPPEEKSDAIESIRFSLKGIRVDPAQTDGLLSPWIKSLGYEDIRADVACHGTYDSARRILEVKQFHAGAGPMAEMTLRLTLENIDLDQMASASENAILLLTTLSSVSIAAAELTYKDGSLVGKIVESEARRLGQSTETYINGMSERIERVFENRSDPHIRNMLDTLFGFLRAPDAITIRMQPERPVPVLALFWARKPDRILKMLGVEIST